MFLIDKYIINDITDIIFHKDIYKKLLNIDSFDIPLNNDNSNIFNNLPHLLIYGPNGCGKKTLIKLLLKRIFGNEGLITKKCQYTITGYGNTDTIEEVEQSKHHIIIEPKNTGYDKYLISEIVINYAKKLKIVSDNAPKFKIVIIKDIDNLSFYAQAALRRIMEKYSNNCKFILYGNQISKIIEPLRSRCLSIRIPSPSNVDIFNTLVLLSSKEKKILAYNDYIDMVMKSDNNIKKAILLLQSKLYNIDITDSWKIDILNITKYIRHAVIKGITDEHIKGIRENLYKVYITNISSIDIMNELVKLFLITFPYNNTFKFNVIKIASKYEERLSQGKRAITHIEAFINNIMRELYIYKINKKNNDIKN